MDPQGPICDACQLPPHGTAADNIVDGVPEGWYRRTFGRRKYLLCDCCGSVHHLKGGVSAYLQEALGIGPYAQCDFSADMASSFRRSEAASRDDDGNGGRA